MKSYMVLISFMGLFTCSFNIAAMGGPGATYLPFGLEEEKVTATADPGATSADFPEEIAEKISNLPYELEEIIIMRTLDSILKEQFPKEKAKLNAVLNQFLLNFLIRPQLNFQNKKYFLNRLAHKYFLTFGRHLNVPDWYLIKYFGEPGKEYTKEEMLALRKNILDYGFSLPERLELIERLDLKKIKVIDGELDLSGLRLNNLEGLLKIPNITTVTYLYLDNNQLKEFPKQITNLPNLQELYLSNNQLKELPKEIANLSNLQILFLGNNQLKEFPKEITNLSNLQKLFLGNNQLKELPKEIANLSNLQILSLGNNQLKEFPKEIANLSNLQKLFLGNNQLKEFPQEIANLPNLQELYLSNNQLKELPKQITNLSNLQKLSLHNNQLKELPKQITNLSNLQKLFLGNNQYLKKQQARIRRMLPEVTIIF